MNDQADADAVRRVLEGDLSAFESIVHRWQKPMVNLAWRLCRRRDLAEDLAQEAFLQVFRTLSSWRADASFSTWMFAVAMNRFRSRLRAMPREFLELEAASDVEDPRAHESVRSEDPRAQSLRRAVLGLPLHYREAIVVHYFEGQDVHRAALILDIAEGTLKARLARARALLAASLRPQGTGNQTHAEP